MFDSSNNELRWLKIIVYMLYAFAMFLDQWNINWRGIWNIPRLLLHTDLRAHNARSAKHYVTNSRHNPLKPILFKIFHI